MITGIPGRYIGALLPCLAGLLWFTAEPARGQGASPLAIEEIIVTARKREESVQDVPVAIQAFDTDTIERYGATNLNEIADLATQVALYPGPSGNGAAFKIRGYGSPSLDPGLESSVGINIDGMQTDRGHVVRQAFFDLQGVEILKGPQALFFGKNSPAGVVAATSALPTDEFEAKLYLGYEMESEERLLEAVLSGPVSDTLNARLALRGSSSEGYVENTATFVGNSMGQVNPAEPFDFPGGANDLGKEDLMAARLTLDWQPSDSFRGIWRLLVTDMENDGYNTAETQRCPGDKPTSLGLIDQNGDCKIDGKQSHGSLPREIAARFSTDVGNGDPFGEFESILSSLNLELVQDWGTITSVTGMYSYDYVRFDNFDGTVYNQLLGIQIEDQTTWTQEVRALTQFDSPLNFMVGAFYEEFERDSDNAGKIAPLDAVVAGAIAAGFPLSPSPYSNTWEGASTAESQSWSLFTQAIWNIDDSWELAAGLRYTNDDKEAVQQNVFVHPGAPVLRVQVPAFPDFSRVGRVLESDFQDEHISPEITLTWRPDSDMTVWAAYRTGYKSGGFSTNSVVVQDATGESLTFEPEEAQGGEFGIKSTLLDGRARLNVTAYSYTFDDLQVSVFDNATTTFTVRNAASATTEGIEVEALLLASDNLSLRGQFGYNKAEYEKFPGAACSTGVDPACPDTATQDLGGEPLDRAPEWQGSIGFDWESPVAANWNLVMASEAVYSDDYQTNGNNNPLAIQEGFWRVNARVGLVSTDGRWDISVVGRNILEEYYSIGSADRAGGVDGRDLYGATVRARQVILQASYSL